MSLDLNAVKKNSKAIQIFKDRVGLRKAGDLFEGLCPFHPEKTPSFKVNFWHQEHEWRYRCYGGCEIGGDVVDFVERYEKVPHYKALEICTDELEGTWDSNKAKVEKVFQPIAPKPLHELTMEQFEAKYPPLTEQAKEYLMGRGLTEETIENAHLRYIPYAVYDRGVKGPGVAIPYLENGKVALVKIRSIGQKGYTREKEMRTAIFNAEATHPMEPVYVTEGEFDALTMIQAGFIAVSLPQASVNIPPELHDALHTAERIVWAGDNEPGKIGTKVMDTLQKQYTDSLRIIWPNGMKDANQTFVEYCKKDVDKFRELVQTLETQGSYQPMKDVVDMKTFLEKGMGVNVTDDPRRLRFPWSEVDDMAIIGPGSVAMVTATNTGTGKTTFVAEATLYESMAFDEVILNYQCELTQTQFANLITANLLRKNRQTLTEADAKAAAKKLGTAKYYVGKMDGLPTANTVLDLIEMAIQRLSVTVAVVDHIQYLTDSETESVKAQDRFMKRAKDIAMKYGIKFIIISQPRKASQERIGKVSDVSDMKGAASLGQDADAVFELFRKTLKVEEDAEMNDRHDTKTIILLQKGRLKGTGKVKATLVFLGKEARFDKYAGEEHEF